MARRNKRDVQRHYRTIFRSFFSSRGFQYLAAERFGPRKSLPWSEEQVSMRSLGAQGEHVLAYLAEHGSRTLGEDDPRIKDRERTQTIEGQVTAWLQEQILEQT